MKRSKSGAQKRKEAATARDAVAKLPKMADFFKITEQSRPGTSTERDEENYSVQEKEDYDDQHQSDCEFPENTCCDLPTNTQSSISKITESQFTPIPDDPCKWPESISNAQRCDIVKRGPHQLIMNFPVQIFAAVDSLRIFEHLTSECKPIATRSRNYTNEDQCFIASEVQRLLSEDIIELSTSAWRAQVLVV